MKFPKVELLSSLPPCHFAYHLSISLYELKKACFGWEVYLLKLYNSARVFAMQQTDSPVSTWLPRPVTQTGQEATDDGQLAGHLFLVPPLSVESPRHTDTHHRPSIWPCEPYSYFIKRWFELLSSSEAKPRGFQPLKSANLICYMFNLRLWYSWICYSPQQQTFSWEEGWPADVWGPWGRENQHILPDLQRPYLFYV